MPKKTTKPWKRDYSEALDMMMGLPFKDSVPKRSRFRDSERELRIRLRVTCRLHRWNDKDWPGGEKFFHEAADKADQFLAATLSGDGETIDVTLFLDKLKQQLGLETVGKVCQDSGNTKRRSGARKAS